VQISVPLYGRLASRLIQGRAFRVLGLLIQSHVSVLESLDLARQVTRNGRFQRMFDSMVDAVTSGRTLHAALDGSRLVSPSICQAVCTGEESGNLGGAISFSADVLDEENGELIDTLTKLVEPMILILMGAIVGFVAVSLFLPLFDITAAVN
jgi:type II secretory pathway component PulF